MELYSIQELENEILRIDASGTQISEATLSKAIQTINSRIRNRGLSAREILFSRDQTTGEKLHFEDAMLSQQQASIRTDNHAHSALSKASKKSPALRSAISIGDLVFIKAERSKLKGRDRYIVMDISDRLCFLQKINGTLFSSRRYEVPLTDVYPVAPPSQPPTQSSNPPHSSDESDTESDHESVPVQLPPQDVPPLNAARKNPHRERRQPPWLRGEEWEKE